MCANHSLVHIHIHRASCAAAAVWDLGRISRKANTAAAFVGHLMIRTMVVESVARTGSLPASVLNDTTHVPLP